MLINRYDYKPINRKTIEGKRHYATPDGNAVPSVTTILDKTKPEKRKMKHYEKKLPKSDCIDRYGKEQGEAIYYATATKMAKKNA